MTSMALPPAKEVASHVAKAQSGGVEPSVAPSRPIGHSGSGSRSALYLLENNPLESTEHCRTANPPFDCYKTYICNVVNDVCAPFGFGRCSSSVFGGSPPSVAIFSYLFALFCH